MSTLEKIKAEIQKVLDAEGDSENARAQALALFWVLELIDKYAEQEPCEDCDYSEIVDWEQDAKTGKSKPIYWCERHKEPCDDAISRQAIKKLKRHNLVEGQFVSLYDIEQLPSVRPQEQTGHWIRITNGAMKEKYICSKCGRQIEDDGIDGLLPIKYPYCHCGAKMVEPRESE